MKVGDKVVCVDFSLSAYGERVPLLPGVVYVISDIYEYYGKMAVHLVGIYLSNDYEGFNASRFRLLDELKQEAREFQQTSISANV